MSLIDDYRWLVSDSGRVWLARVQEDARLLAKGASRLRQHLTAVQTQTLLEQIELRRRAARRFEHAYRLFFTARGLQQATDSRLATYKASRFAASHVLHL